MDSQLDRIERKLDRIETWMNGDGDTPGVRVRLDRMERAWKVVTWIGGAIIAAIITAVTSLYSSGKH